MNNQIKKSKRLAYLLRHSDLPDYNGWAKMSEVLGNLGVSLQDLQQIVESDNKGRFEFSEDKSSVRALYGHSVDVDLELDSATFFPPPPLRFCITEQRRST